LRRGEKMEEQKRLHLVFVVSNSKYIGGGSYIAFKYAEELAKRGHMITVFADNYPKLFENKKLPKTMKIYIRKNIAIFPSKGKGFYLSYVTTGLLDKILQSGYDYVKLSKRLENFGNVNYIIGFPTLDGIRSVRLSKRLSIPLVTFAYESPLWVKERLKNNMTLKTKLKFFVRNIVDWGPMKKALLNSDKIIAISELAKHDFERWLNSPIDGVVHPGVDSDFIDSIPNQNEEYQIIYVGRLFTNKNVDEIIKALSKISTPPKFVIIGHGPERPKLEKLAIELNVNCEFNGIVSDYDKWVEIKKSVFMVVATSFEGSADVPSEALYCEKPCLATDIPIMRADYGDTIQYFKEHDIDDLAEKIKFLIDNPRYRKMKGREGKRFVDENYTLA
jgi:glycosyltransferase involved in cell wall biosynthesis